MLPQTVAPSLQSTAPWHVEHIQQHADGSDGGDFVVTRRHGARLQIFIGDATGHGPAAASVAAHARQIIDRDCDRPVNPELLAEWNAEIGPRHGDKFVCLTYIEIDDATHRARVANCGNPEVLVLRHGGQAIEHCPATGMPLGIIEPSAWHGPTIAEFELDANDAFVCVTDGVTEQAGPAKQRFGIERVQSAVATTTFDRVLTFLSDCLTRFAGGMPREDDVTMLCVGRAV